MIDSMPVEARAQLSDAWLRLVDEDDSSNPWIHGFKMLRTADGVPVGNCGFKGPPGTDGSVEIAYSVETEYQNLGYASEAASAVVTFAFDSADVSIVRAHTMPQENASTRVLSKCGFTNIGDTQDPDDGLVWRWEVQRSAAPATHET